MDHRDFISRIGCMTGKGIQSYCFITYKNFLESSSLISSLRIPKASTSAASSFKILTLISSSLIVLYLSFKPTYFIKGPDNDDDTADDNKSILKSVENNNDDNKNNDIKQSFGLGLGISGDHDHNKQIDILENHNENHVGLGVGMSNNKKSLKPNSARRQTIISKSVVAKKDNAIPPKPVNDEFFDELSSGISINSPITYNLDEDLKYEDIFEDKELNINTSPLRKSKDESDFETPKSKHAAGFHDSPYDIEDDKLTMLHVVSTTWTLPIKVNVEMNREDAVSYFSYHKDKTDNPKFKFECFTLTSPFASWIIEKGLFEILTLEIKINSEFPKIREEIIKKGGKILSRSELEQFRSTDLESSMQMFKRIIGDYFANIMSRKAVLRKQTTNSILTDFFDPPSFKRPRDPFKQIKKII